MASKVVFQTDSSRMLCGISEADESPLQPGVYLIPSGCVDAPPPQAWPPDKWPRWSGVAWELVARPGSASKIIDRLSAAFRVLIGQ